MPTERIRRPLATIVATGAGVLLIASSALAGGGYTATTYFESPKLYAREGSRVISPYVAQGVTFAAESTSFNDDVVGLVKNSVTSACVEPASANQLLGTGRESSNSVGKSGFPIRATFSTPLRGQRVDVWMDLQAAEGTVAELIAFDAAGKARYGFSATVPSGGGTCGYPGPQRGRLSFSAPNMSGEIGSVLIRTSTGGRVFVIDNFGFLVNNAY